MISLLYYASLANLIPTNRRHAVTNVVFGAGLVVILWLCWDFDNGPCFVPKPLRRYLLFPEDYEIPDTPLGELERKQLALNIEHQNSQAEVINWDKYRPVNPDTTIIVINVNKDVERLQYLIVSLGQVRYIWRVLLIFSHSYFDEGINYLVKSINFCKVMQIFYPYSLQLYPSKYFGANPDDCNDTVAALNSGPCALRDAERAQRKLHWWWTANYVFEGEWGLDDRIVIFLEEDDYVLPDLLYVSAQIWRGLPTTVEVVSLGGPTQRQLNYGLLKMDYWAPSYAKGLALNANTWWKISERSSFFCFYDDYRWSHSLLPVFGNFSRGFAEMAACSAPRVLSTRAFKSARRGAHSVWLAGRRTWLFPLNIHVTLTVGAHGHPRPAPTLAPPAGGWSDPQDQLLCLDPLMKITTEAPLDTALPSKTEIKNLLRISNE